MVAVNEIGWGSYANYEGPFYMGKAGVKVQQSSGPAMVVMVTAAAEGGHYDAWNGYDSCGWTSGAIQWCERSQFSVSDMLGQVALQSSGQLDGVIKYADSVGMDFSSNQAGKWRFKFRDSRGFVDNGLKQQQLFYRTGNGNKGTWTNDTKIYAKGWAAAISTLWEDSAMQVIQAAYTYERLPQFLLQPARNLFSMRPTSLISDAIYAAYVSFAVNNPSWASSSLQQAVASKPNNVPMWSEAFLVHMLKHLTFDPRVAIYPARYNAIRPVLESLYSVQLPDFANELQAWKADTGLPSITTKQLQLALISLGYDLGPRGADNSYGKYTKDALFAFEQQNGVPAEKQDGMIDEATYPALEKALAAHGLSFPAP